MLLEKPISLVQWIPLSQLFYVVTFVMMTTRAHPTLAAAALELIPNNSNESTDPVSFAIKFIAGGMLVEYSFSVALGKFLEIDYQRKVLSEMLKINNTLIFSRNDGLEFDSLETIQELLVNAFEQNAEGAISLAKSNLNDDELFLMTVSRQCSAPSWLH